MVEDPATGAAAAALGAYLRALGLIEPPVRLTVHQGEDLGRPSLLLGEVPAGAHTGIRVSGRAARGQKPQQENSKRQQGAERRDRSNRGHQVLNFMQRVSSASIKQ